MGSKLIILITLLFLVSPVQVVAQDTNVCQADSAAALTNCLAKLSNATVKAVEITQSILCSDTDPCNFYIVNTNGGQVYGTPGREIKLIRSKKYRPALLTINNSQNITIGNVIFDDDQNIPKCTYGDTNCVAQISIINSSDISFHQVKLLESKAQAITLSASKNFSFINSTITSTFLQGVWMPMPGIQPAEVIQNGVFIKGSIFENTYAEALFLAGKNMQVIANYLNHNQWNPPWITQGSQVNFTGIDGLHFLGNRIVNGKYDSAHPNKVTPGIETAPDTSNKNIFVKHNDISANTGWGLVGGIGSTIPNLMQNFVVEQNQFLNNFLPDIIDLSNQNTWTLKNNCIDTNCNLPAYGTISVAPNPCFIPPGSDRCSVSLAWQTNFAPNVEVKAGNSIIAQNSPSGTKIISWITTIPTTFNLINNGTILDSVTIKAEATTTPLPSPVTKPGDLNGDDSVNIFDFNLLVSNFGNPYTIFDFNKIIANYGG